MRRVIAVLVIGFSLACSSLLAAEQEKSNERKGYDCLFIGHSFFVPVAKRFEGLPGKCGVKGHRQRMVFSGGRSGSPGELWRGGKRASIQKILDSGEIELLGMTYYNSENSSLDAYARWIDYAIQNNPDTAFFIGLPWGKDGARRKLDEYAGANEKASASLCRTVQALRKRYPKNTFYYANYGMASGELKRLFEAGQLPDVSKMVDRSSGVYRDPMGHAGGILLDLAAMIWLPAIYDIDLAKCPVKLEHPTDLNPIAAKLVAEQKRRQEQVD